mmetsp:Transcript_8882/g.28070  ORF Transcript_8882/g.28070 Transcript_8882/m.28070 type:complete len:292 (+) Transcript_8882:74-949(+)
MLTFERIEQLRSLGRAIKAKSDGCLPNVDATLRRLVPLKKGTKMEKYFAGHGVCKGKLVKEEEVDSPRDAGQQVKAWLVKYDSDGHEEHFEEFELRSGRDGPAPAAGDGRPVLVVRDLPERAKVCDQLTPGFDYLEARITGTCDAQYSCATMHDICDKVRAFDPNFASAHVNDYFIDSMDVIKPLVGLGMLSDLKRELHKYLAAAIAAPPFNRASVNDYSEELLKWWRINGSSFPAWARAARVVFALSPNSASCERVFSLLESMFDEEQRSTLADALQAALMLRYNNRRVG